MRGSRAKALRRALTKSLGHPPAGMTILGATKDGNLAYIPSQWRRAKKAARRTQ